ncbi:MAG TPA: CDP-archaeol synthase [Candidatus Sumerlaeota bacterium]|nr:CDP-archaeol synthase [Candidatus Sumerlaeota bacterium]HMX62536.1 CDP-archaeol synthase [Candidatus Sumerlaeota bacterium]HMZ51136.1 CDP-archaeol synthase [Candidatus Sumerlaeota bacterium]HNM46051.1 CDP-archaeol synthase [Candidatus Sumerlaeota bacterium]
MGRRILAAVICLPLIGVMFYFDWAAFLFYLAIIGITCMSVWEMRKILRPKNLTVNFPLGIIGALALLLEAHFTRMDNALLVMGACTCIALATRLKRRISGAAADVAVTVFTIAYVGIPMASLLRVFNVGPQGEAWLLLMLSTVWVTDSMALIVGKNFGKHKMSPEVSPNKTWEGAIGGTLGSLIVPLVTYYFFRGHYLGVTLLEMLLFTLLCSLIAQFGDLGESLLKRDTGVKDSGSKWTGHGGFLDRMDAILFTAVALLIYLKIMHPTILEAAVS